MKEITPFVFPSGVLITKDRIIKTKRNTKLCLVAYEQNQEAERHFNL